MWVCCLTWKTQAEPRPNGSGDPLTEGAFVRADVTVSSLKASWNTGTILAQLFFIEPSAALTAWEPDGSESSCAECLWPSSCSNQANHSRLSNMEQVWKQPRWLLLIWSGLLNLPLSSTKKLDGRVPLREQLNGPEVLVDKKNMLAGQCPISCHTLICSYRLICILMHNVCMCWANRLKML